MRVTNKMLSDNFLNDMQTNLSNMKTLDQQMTSGKNFKKPSDDPFNVARSMQMHSSIDTNKQYNKNITNTINWLDTTDTALGQIGNVVQGIREKLVSAGNAAYGSDERTKIKDEINQRVGQISQILNTNFDGEFIFGGTKGSSKPVDSIKDSNGNNKLIYCNSDGKEIDMTKKEDKMQFDMISSKRQTEISQGVLAEYNVSASQAIKYGDTDKDDIRALFARIVNHLDGKDDKGNSNGDVATKALTNEDLTDMDQAMKQILKLRSEVGAKQNRMDSAKDQNIQGNFDMTEILSKTEDIDFTKKSMEVATMQTVYMAALQTSSKVLMPTLLDYMR